MQKHNDYSLAGSTKGDIIYSGWVDRYHHAMHASFLHFL